MRQWLPAETRRPANWFSLALVLAYVPSVECRAAPQGSGPSVRFKCSGFAPYVSNETSWSTKSRYDAEYASIIAYLHSFGDNRFPNQWANSGSTHQDRHRSNHRRSGSADLRELCRASGPHDLWR